MRGSNGWVIGVGLVALGCGDVEVGDESGNPFGDGTASSTGTSTTTPGTRGTAEDTAGTQGSQGTASTTDGPTTDASTAEGSSGPTTGPTTGSATTTASESSGGPGEGQLGECLGTGAWSSCAQYCEANLEFCVEGGCDGQTVVYYDDFGACTDLMPASGEATPCTEGFAMGGGISFARCCCT
ncbi:MAG: hypothetical protein KDK70_31660 [Myxococcales bacterium]|nr:hypothetical protein [Myxococcales bacterium]